ncbi:hypothetical protein [Sinorhizobium medicae]|uniref:Uncharacterized protein n=2 Tax=Sinorhizobium medicae TaxID=110321 RepID=A6UCR5_SINMW|nr:hypothetical protein [Sinorhizobium medicae]ABR61445.1 conserved hypothetical protein [Sinorhizobium medicae WSM419]MBO1943073.1 hypothetical protein [Sinorhizobium medicae]MDX0405170.1 hypothetical protein [Sinorhizobium medicae]MDX0410845.1 hypothetical protein [Sinorhizobium medicae]MDX0417272.1 hypothetical protein [Sinorhizobium medicae]
MADFVAVIRRTVDGLSENTPEMRGRVYEKARGAVRRQLESMNPRPSDDMIGRQLNKLEQAISEVEGEYAEALPPIDEAETLEPISAEELPTDEDSTPLPQEPVPDSAPAEAAEAEQPATAQLEEPSSDGGSAEEPEDRVEAVPDEETPAPGAETATADMREEAPVREEEPVEAAPAAPQWDAPIEEQAPAGEAETHAEYPAEEETAIAPGPQDISGDAAATHPSEPTPVEARTDIAGADDVPAHDVPTDDPLGKREPSEWALPEWEDATPSARPSEVTAEPEAPRQDDVSPVEPERLGIHPVEPERAETEQQSGEADTARSWSFDDSDPFAQGTEVKKERPADEVEISEWSWPVEKSPAAAGQEEHAGTAWDHVGDLLGLDDGRTANGSASQKDNDSSLAAPPAIPARPASYRTTPKPSRFSIKRLSIGVAVVLLLGAGGYAYWENREAGNAWLSDMVAKIMPGEPAEAPATTAPGQDDPADQPAGQSGAQDNAAQSDVNSTKFTQRLLANGTERDEGPAVANDTAASQEGKSVAARTHAGEPENTDAGLQQAAAGETASPAAGQAPSETAQPEVSVADGEKMFLYEERLGQSSPTAIPGAVAWSVKEESPGGDAKPEPAIQAQITVPDRGLTALLTIKRNADPSLPASHVIEFVFSLPENFEGGAIDGVQRVSMKRTEQDRGDPLIAVPAKITDDFHMIALNDFAEAVSNNTELLRSRSWIDIPITYRNGRRALLTLEKGQSGAEAFNKALQAWSALGSTASSGQ